MQAGQYVAVIGLTWFVEGRIHTRLYASLKELPVCEYGCPVTSIKVQISFRKKNGAVIFR